VGSRSDNNNYAYIAGFLDGDGSLMLQIKKRSDTKYGLRIMATICLYQDTRHEKPLIWMRNILGIGYISRRNDGISELRINGFSQIEKILLELKPHIKFKKLQTQALIKACSILSKTKITQLNQREKRKILEYIWIIQQENYSSRKRSKKDLKKLLDLTP